MSDVEKILESLSNPDAFDLEIDGWIRSPFHPEFGDPNYEFEQQFTKDGKELWFLKVDGVWINNNV